jgi:hypothetical protein
MTFRFVFVAALAACGPTQMGAMGDPGETGPPGAQGPPGPAGPGLIVREATGTGQLVVSAATSTFTLIPGLSTMIDVPAGGLLDVHTDGGLQCTGVGNTYSVVDIAIFIDGLQTTASRRVVAANTVGLAQVIANWSFSRHFNVTGGTHLVEIRAVAGDAGAANANVSSAAAPQLQGVVTATAIPPP